ncbi:TerB family tellurite resistance protein, partial [Streptomyces sp. NRRL B-24572]|uniref:TerB family tellurite resistance protein n=1 Tax=Streptomyces sp. NRRL B-24572 TaxID=1962156 RepID=UPI000A365CA7
YRRRTGRRRFAVLGVPVLPRGCTGPVVECAACHTHFGTEVLDHPTTSRFSAMLRDAVHTVALAVLAAGGTESREVLDRAVTAVRSAGYAECTAVQLVDLVEALEADTGRFMPEVNPEGALLAIELHEALEPLTPHLAPAGRESILLQAARIALADGAYSPSETEVLGTVGNALALAPEDTVRLLASARTVP